MTAIATMPVMVQSGNHAGRPAASAVGSGAQYWCTTHNLVYQQIAGSWGTLFTLPTSGFANPMTTAEDIIYGGASGAPTRKAKGSDGTFLGVASGALIYQAVTDALLSTSDITTNNVATTKHGFAPKLPNDATKYLDGTGAYSVPAGSGGSGALVLLEQHTAASSATLDFTAWYSSTYDDYAIEFVRVLPATDGANLVWQASTDAGSTWDSTSGHYAFSDIFAYISTGGGEGSSSAQTAAQIAGSCKNANLGVSGFARLADPASTSQYKSIQGTITHDHNSVGLIMRSFTAAFIQSATDVDGMRFKFSSGNIASGTIRVYGIAKS